MSGATAELWEAPGGVRELSPYPWQMEAVNELRTAILQGHRALLLVAPTGSGKTVMATYLIRECGVQKRKRAMFVVDRLPLVEQTSAVLDDYGIPHGVIQADHWRRRPHELIQVASVDTLKRRDGERRWPADLSLLIVDEAHTRHQIIEEKIAQGDTVVVGLTATPFTKGLGRLYTRAVNVRTTNELFEYGYLVRPVIYAPSKPDMEGVKEDRKTGEWEIEETARRAGTIIGDLVAEYNKHGRRPDGSFRKFICFGVNVAHCEEIKEAFQRVGIICGLCTYRTPDSARAEMIQEFKKRDSMYHGLVSVAALAKGFDNPAVEVVIMARPLKRSLAEHIQILGRGLRVDPENPSKVCTVLDHSGNMDRFYYPMMDFFQNGAPPLDMGEPKEKPEPQQREREPSTCPECKRVHDPAPVCPYCGHEYKRSSAIEVLPGELQQINAPPLGKREDRQAVFSGLLQIAADWGQKPVWARWRYKERFGVWPNGLHEVPGPYTRDLEGWARSRQIAYLQALKKQRREEKR